MPNQQGKGLCDVLIIGAGPTGLMMASELSRYGVNCRIIDRSLAATDYSRALAIQPRTMEIFHFLGIDTEFIQKGQPVRALNIFGKRGPIGRLEMDLLPSPYPFILSLPQSNTEEILNRKLEAYGIYVERGQELVELEEKADMAIATLQSQKGLIEKVEAKWIIGCDGAHSFVRKHLRLNFQGKAFPEVFSLADVQVDWKYPHEEVCAFWHPEGILAAIPLPEKGVYRLIFQLGRCQNHNAKEELDNLKVDLPPPTLDEVQEVVKKYADPNGVVSEPKWLANFHVNSRLVNRYQVGRFFLAGDAAHIHSPVGGQGMNTGIQDAFNLAWKLAFTLQQKASGHLLGSYHEERHSIATALLRGTEVGTRIVALKKSWEISLRDGIVSFLLQFDTLREKMISTISQIKIQYPTSRVIWEGKGFKEGPRAGVRLPDCELESGGRLFDFLVDMQSFLILFFLGNKGEAEKYEELIEKIEKLDLPTRVIFILRGQDSQSSDSVILDSSGKLHQMFGAEKGACYVVRPDTYIGYSQTPIHPEAMLTYLKENSHS